jgi:hypothetical protein
MLLSALAEDFDAVLAALDLVFRWVVLRLCEGNMQALVKVCELTNALLNALYENVSLGVGLCILHVADPFWVPARCTACKRELWLHRSSCRAVRARDEWTLLHCCRATSWRMQRRSCCCRALLRRRATAR